MANVRHLGLFPWCLNADEQFFKGSDISSKAVPMWWRVKKWKLESEYTAKSNLQETNYAEIKFFDITTLTKQIVVDDEIQIVTLYSAETDLVCGGVIYDEESKQSYRVGADHLFPFSMPLLNTDTYVKLGPKFDFQVLGDDINGATVAGDGQILGNLALNYCGLSFSIPLKLLGNFGGLSELTSINCTLEAVEYWRYDPGDGLGPIYDSQTGKQLRTFPA
ncbi:MAG: hypothetical protein EBR82_36275 [Caulobacteraceae bacterium]|nr:hypothetical protein [Caulobacteraceae bacterium]